VILLDQVADGEHVILVMLIVGLVFVAVIGLGELTHHLTERRRERKRQLRSY
jgi:peptidoglycan/LPS O-acetylase OafA/YrhL